MSEELGTIYRQIANGDGKNYEFLFSLEGLFLSVMDFDPVTDDPLPVTVDDVLHVLASFDFQKGSFQNDRLQHVIDFASSAVRNLIDILHEKNLREHRISRPEQVREVDSKSMMWLAKKPGFTVKQKIASEQRMMGVYHTTSIDTAENRLFKAFMERLEGLLLEKENACKKLGLEISDDAERFTSTVHRWLKTDEASLIGRWNNTPPNNTLLNDRNYRKIWKAHLMLQNLDGQIENDLKHFDRLKITALFWITAAKLNLNQDIRFRQQLLFPDYHELSLTNNAVLQGFARTDSWKKLTVSGKENALTLTLDEKGTEYSLPDDVENLFDIYSCAEQICSDFFPKMKFESNVLKQIQNEKTQEVAAVDLNSVLPTFTLGDKTKGLFNSKLLHQSIFVKGKKSWFPCSSSRSKLIFTKSKETKTFSIHSIFDEKLRSEIDADENRNEIEKACADFAKRIKDELHCQKCLYVAVDDLDDFSPTVNAFKHSMNSAFSKTEIVPRSIATLFANLSSIQKQFKDGDEITVCETSDDSYEVKTRIKIVYEKELAGRNPETKGIWFQRLVVEKKDLIAAGYPELIPENLHRIITSRDARLLKNNFSADGFHFDSDYPVNIGHITHGENTISINQCDDTSSGAIEYDRLQGITPDIPLWRDVLPKLSMVDSTGKEYVLVEPGKVSVKPIVGKPVHIPISWRFSFPPQRKFYEFPLAQGEKKEKSKYFAFIKDSSFPLENETECTLHLSYTYGIPLPYNLEFIPVSDSAEFKSAVVKWENKSHKDFIHDMPVPNFVREYTWDDMTRVAGRKTGKKSIRNITGEWLPKEYLKISNSGVYRIRHQIPSKKNGQGVFFLNVTCRNGKNPICYIDANQHASIGSHVWCYLDEVSNGYQGFDPHVVGSNCPSCSFTKSLRFPAITVWNNNRSIYDDDCPKAFRDMTLNVVQKLKDCFGDETPECVMNEYMFFLSCMHKDMPDWFSQILPKVLSMIEKHYDYPNWIAYSLGDCSTDWQMDLLLNTIDLLGDKNKAEYAIKILAKALWRVNEFVFNFSADETGKILSSIKTELCSKKKRHPEEEKGVVSACLECIIALCRLRNTKDHELADEKMLRLLSMATNDDVKMIVSKLKEMKETDVKLKTFLSFEIDRPTDDQTPELLYAAYGYLSGEIDSNAIKVLEADFGE